MQGNAQGLNPYGYVNGNPQTHSDPTGRYIGTVTPITQKGGAMAYINPATGASMTIVNDGYSVTSIDGQSSGNRSGLDVTIYTYGPTDPSNANYDPNTDYANSPWAKFSRDIGLTDMVTTFSDPNASFWDKLFAVPKFLWTSGNYVLQLAMIFAGGAEAEGVVASGEEGASVLSRLAEGCGALSFAPTTPVATAQGEQAIGKLHIGDKVWAYNPTTHKMELEPVLHVWINHDNDLVDLTLTSSTHLPHSGKLTHTSEVIHTNQKHPFLTREKGFLPVGQIKLGMHVLRADGTYGVVTGWKVVPGTKAMYNLEVAQDHTFTVGSGQWVVHNCGGGGLPATTEESVARKLDDYLLNPDHPVGGSKAEWFRLALGYTRENAAGLAAQIVFDPSAAVQMAVTPFGTKYNQIINIIGANDRAIDVLFAWIRNTDDVVRLVTAFPAD